MRSRVLNAGHPCVSPAEPQFKVVVAFDNTASSARALETCEYVVSQLGGDVRVCRKIVNFDGAPTRRSLAAATREAARADMVIVSTHEDSHLPSEMEKWMHDWSLRRSTEEGALVAILDRGRNSAVRSQLADVARQAHMDFFSSEGAGM